MKTVWKNIRLGIKLATGYVVKNLFQFLLGFVISVALVYFFPIILAKIPSFQRQKIIGRVGNFTVSTLPKDIQKEISFGILEASTSWMATDSGKTYIFYLKKDLYWHDGKKLISSDINYNLKGVTFNKIDDSTVKFSLKEPFAPLLTLLSQPLFKNGLVGLGKNRVTDIKFSNRFISSIRFDGTTIKFYPTEKALITAFKLGAVKEIAKIRNSYNLGKITEQIDGQTLAMVFFNTAKKPFDEKSFRQNLVYALPDTFIFGETADSPLPKDNWVKTANVKKYPHTDKMASVAASFKIILNTSKELEPVAKIVVDAWKEAKINSEVQISDVISPNYDAFLAYVELPEDPDQYLLWHSTQTGNIANYKSFKVDKLLEEGRRETDQTARKEIYGNFVRAITEDVPAAFLFYPKIYNISRK